MDRIIARLLFENWQQKLMALFAAIAVWVFVNQSIIATKTIPNIPVRIANLPEDKAISGLLPNGILDRRMTLTLSGTKDIVDELEPGDFEVLLDVANAERETWIVNVTKKNLVSLNPSIDLSHHITQVDHSDFIIELSELMTAKVPVIVSVFSEVAPEGYEFLDVWPQRLTQTVNGPVEDVERLKSKGLKLILDLSQVSRSDIDAIPNARSSEHDDEVSFIVPNQWKKVTIPFHHHDEEQINDPAAENLHINYLRKQLLPFEKTIPIRVFYPLKSLPKINPNSFPLAYGGVVKDQEGITVIDYPLYVRNVDSIFLDIIKDSVEVVVLAAPPQERKHLLWKVEIHNPHELEKKYVAKMISREDDEMSVNGHEREDLLRKRFQSYAQRLRFYTGKNKKFRLKGILENNKITVTATSQGIS